jgi:hypothetical protein
LRGQLRYGIAAVMDRSDRDAGAENGDDGHSDQTK